MFGYLSLQFFLLTASANARPMKRGISAPALSSDFPDPSLFKLRNTWYAHGTGSRGIHVQVARSDNFNTWTQLNKDAMPNLPSWVYAPKPEVWAPDVVQGANGTFVLYFSAALDKYPSHHCVGVALSNSVEGPFQPMSTPLICPDPVGNGAAFSSMIPSPGSGGAIDASGFTDTDGSRYILYKIDGNSLRPGGPCGNPGPNYMPTPIMIVPVGSDGVTARGPAVQLLDRESRDGPLIEAPSLVRTPDGTYNLFFSSNCWNTPQYDVTWASASRLTGPYTKYGPLFVTTAGGLTAPGGATVASDGQHVVFHANLPRGGRAMYSTIISGAGPAIRYID